MSRPVTILAFDPSSFDNGINPNINLMNQALLAEAAKFFGATVLLADGYDELNLLVNGNAYVDSTKKLPDIYESILFDESFYHPNDPD